MRILTRSIYLRKFLQPTPSPSTPGFSSSQAISPAALSSPYDHSPSHSNMCSSFQTPNTASEISESSSCRNNHIANPAYRHQRSPSTASHASTHSICPDTFSSVLTNPLTDSPACSYAEITPNNLAYVEEPLPMEGEFASLDLQSNSNSTLTEFLQSHNSQAPFQPQRYDTLSWAREHAFPEPRQETMLATGGLHPRSSISSMTALLDPNRSRSRSNSSTFRHENPAGHQTPFSCPDILPPSLAPAPTHLIGSAFIPSPCPSPAHSSFSGSEQMPIPTINVPTSAGLPTSPLLRLDMNHPAMSASPSISLTAATPLTARPNEANAPPDFQKVLQQISQAKTIDPGQLQPLSALHSHPSTHDTNSSYSQLDQVLFGSVQNMSSSNHLYFNNTPSLLDPRPTRSRQRSKSESLAQNTQPHFELNPLDFLSGSNPLPNSSYLSGHLSASGSESAPAATSDPWPSFPPGPDPPAPSYEDSRQARRSVGGPGYDTSFLQAPSRRPNSVNHGHRRGRSEGQIFTPPPAPAPSGSLGAEHNFLNELFGLGPEPWSGNAAAHFLPIDEQTSTSTPMSARERSYSHSSLSSDHSLSVATIDYQSRTTAATKAAAAKRRKEGVEARYVCEMCGETFTRRYNLRGER